MTTIAWDGETLAADTLFTAGSNREGYAPKITKRGRILAAVAGNCARSQRFLDWFNGGAKGDPPDMGPEGKDAYALIIMPDGLLINWGNTGWERTRAPNFAMGTGGEFAQGAMSAGVDARRAVEIAILHDTKSGGEIMALRR